MGDVGEDVRGAMGIAKEKSRRGGHRKQLLAARLKRIMAQAEGEADANWDDLPQALSLALNAA